MSRKRLPWIKLWFEMLGDPKMTRLTLAERGCWHEILLLAGQSPVRGKLMLTENEPMTLEDIGRALSLTSDEFPVLESCVAKLTKLSSLSWNSHNCLEVIHFLERQDKYPSDFENRHKKAREKLVNNSENAREKLLKEEEGRGEGQKKDITSPNGEEVYSPKPADEIKVLFDLWNSLGLIKHRSLTGDMTRAIKAASRDFSAAEISQAMKNYAHIVNDKQCYFKHKWTLKDFLNRGLEKFLDLEVALNNYRRQGGDGGIADKHSGPGEPQSRKPAKFDPSKSLR